MSRSATSSRPIATACSGSFRCSRCRSQRCIPKRLGATSADAIAHLLAHVKKIAKQRPGNSFVLRSGERVIDLMPALTPPESELLPMEQMMAESGQAISALAASWPAACRFRWLNSPLACAAASVPAKPIQQHRQSLRLNLETCADRRTLSPCVHRRPAAPGHRSPCRRDPLRTTHRPHLRAAG